MSTTPPEVADLVRQVAADEPAGGPNEGDARAAGANVCGDFHIRIARDGTWFYHGSPISRKPLCRLFSTVLRRDDAGDYWLVTPVEKGRIVVDDAPFTAVALTIHGAGPDQRLVFRTNLDDEVEAGADHPIRVEHDSVTLEPSPYLLVRDRLEALIVRAVFYDLVDIAVPRDGGDRVEGDDGVDGGEIGVWSNGSFFSLGRIDGT